MIALVFQPRLSSKAEVTIYNKSQTFKLSSSFYSMFLSDSQAEGESEGFFLVVNTEFFIQTLRFSGYRHHHHTSSLVSLP